MPATTARQATFASRYRNHRLVVEPTDYEWKGNRIVGETKGHTIEFEDGLYRTSDPEEIAFLEAKSADGVVYRLDEQSPDPSSVLVELVTASVERAQEILDLERDGWNREPVVQAAEAKLSAAPSNGTSGEVDDAPHGYKEDGTPKKAPGRPRKE